MKDAPDALWYARAVLEDPGRHDAETIEAACTLVIDLSDDPAVKRAAQSHLLIGGDDT